VVVRADVRAATDVARAIKASDPGVVVAFGGHRAGAVQVGEADGVLILPSDMQDAVKVLRDEMARTA
jgi:hypothetical protein